MLSSTVLLNIMCFTESFPYVSGFQDSLTKDTNRYTHNARSVLHTLRSFDFVNHKAS